MTELPSHPDAADDPRGAPRRRIPPTGTLIGVTLAAAVLVLVVVLHLTGVLGAEAHS